MGQKRRRVAGSLSRRRSWTRGYDNGPIHDGCMDRGICPITPRRLCRPRQREVRRGADSRVDLVAVVPAALASRDGRAMPPQGIGVAVLVRVALPAVLRDEPLAVRVGGEVGAVDGDALRKTPLGGFDETIGETRRQTRDADSRALSLRTCVGFGRFEGKCGRQADTSVGALCERCETLRQECAGALRARRLAEGKATVGLVARLTPRAGRLAPASGLARRRAARES